MMAIDEILKENEELNLIIPRARIRKIELNIFIFGNDDAKNSLK
jgi:hypothetical protein